MRYRAAEAADGEKKRDQGKGDDLHRKFTEKEAAPPPLSVLGAARTEGLRAAVGFAQA